MLVKDCMTRHPILIAPETPAAEAQRIMAENKIRHLPVAGDGKRLLGLVTRQQLALKPDMLASLNVWEITRHLATLTVKDVMLKAAEVYTIDPERTVERAARILSEHKIGCLPVVEEGIVVGILTEIDLLHAFQQMLGLPTEGVRVTVRMPNRPGEFARLVSALGKHNLGVMGIGTFPSPRREGFYDAVLKIPRVTPAQVEAALKEIPEQTIVDIRDVV
ncbi:MAG: CBS domain-containing protein [Caldilineae bacterium]|nr:MAG: CBS domain-containing protein [Caldilineae bacterium]